MATSTLKMIRQRSLLLPDQVYGISIAVESQQEPPLLWGPSPLTSKAPAPSRHLLWKQRAENVLWIASAFFIIYYGDFRSNFFTLLANDPRVRRTPLHLGSACLILDMGIFLYLAVRLRARNRIQESLDVVAPGAVPAATLVGLAAFILFCVALWPIWNILTVPMLLTLFMAFTVVAPYLSPYVSMKLDADSLCYKVNS